MRNFLLFPLALNLQASNLLVEAALLKIPDNLLPSVVQVRMKQLKAYNNRTTNRGVKSFMLKYKNSSEYQCCVFTWRRSRCEFSFTVNPVPFFLQPCREVLPLTVKTHPWKNVENADWDWLARWGTLRERGKYNEKWLHTFKSEAWGYTCNDFTHHSKTRVENYRKWKRLQVSK